MSGHGSKKVIFCSKSSKENEHPQVNDSSQESESSKDFHLHSETTPPRIDADFSSADDGTCMGSERGVSSTTRLSSPSPTRSSGSPDSGYSTIELEPGSRALSLARLAVRVRDGEGEEVVAALHLLARLLDGTWGEEEAKVSFIISHPFAYLSTFNITICMICMPIAHPPGGVPDRTPPCRVLRCGGNPSEKGSTHLPRLPLPSGDSLSKKN